MPDQPVRSFDFGAAFLHAIIGVGRNALVLLTLNLTVTLAVGVIEAAALIAAGGVAAFRPGAGGGLAVAAAVVVWLICFGFQFAFLQSVVADAVAREPPDARESFAAAFSRGMRAGLANAGPVGSILLIRGLAVFLASLFFILPGMFLSLIWTVAVPAQVVEKTGVFGAFSRSIELTQGNWLMIFGFNLVAGLAAGAAFYFGLVIVVVFVGVAGIAGGLGGAGNGPGAVALVTVGALLYYLLFTLFFAAVAAIPAAVYRELRAARGETPATVAAVFS
jgi:hypothetical protein